MSRFELSISPDYVPNWGLVEAVRELFQNALDQQTINPENEMSYKRTVKDFYISSKESILEKSSLLLGCSSKSEDETTIGKFGEGYKLALLVLTRLNYQVTIYNYAAKEVWTPKIIKSRRYNSDLLVVDVKKHYFSSVPDNNLTFKINDVTCDDFNLIIQHNLFMQKEYDKINTKEGEILLDDCYQGMLFVNGLYINKVDEKVATKGYNFNPKVINLDRDRSLVDAFDLNWATSRIWRSVSNLDLCRDLILNDAPDVKYVKSFLSRQSESVQDIADNVFNSFQAIHGLDTIPVSTQVEFDQVKKEYPALRPKIASVAVTEVINNSLILNAIKDSSKQEVKTKSVKTKIEDLIDEYVLELPDDFMDELFAILLELDDD